MRVTRRDFRLIFLHIPKTAGTTIDSIFRTYFRQDEICPERLDGIGLWPPDRIRKYRFFSMHDSFRNMQCIPEPRRIMTVVREPIDRLLSQYIYWRSYSNTLVESQNILLPRLARAYDLRAFLRCPVPRLLPKIDNVMTRFLSDEAFGPDGMPWRSDEAMLETALRNLEAIEACAVYEHLPASLELVCRTLDLTPPGSLPRTNVTRENYLADPERFEHADSLVVDDETEELLVRRTRLDAIVYAAARQRLFRQIGAQQRLVRCHVPEDLLPQPRHSATIVQADAGIPRYVLFGPYIRLPRGQYRLVCRLCMAAGPEVAADAPIAHIDVCSQAGARVHVARPVLCGDLADGLERRFELAFTLDRTETDLEFRVFQTGSCALAVDMLMTLDDRA